MINRILTFFLLTKGTKSVILAERGDKIIDLLNNRIGRKLGHNNKKSSIKEIALLVLDEFLKNGLYTYEIGDDGIYYIKKEKMSDQSYMDIYNSILKLDNNGRE